MLHHYIIIFQAFNEIFDFCPRKVRSCTFNEEVKFYFDELQHPRCTTVNRIKNDPSFFSYLGYKINVNLAQS